MSICLIDTSILCAILEIPNMSGSSDEVAAQLRQKQESRESLLLPLCTILETGNHIGQNGDGRLRRRIALDFVNLVERAIDGSHPFIATPFFTPDGLRTWLAEFPDWAGLGSGLGDLTILKEFERQCRINPSRCVYIWSSDGHLSSYRRDP